MALNLRKAGLEVVVHDISPGSATRHLAAGCEWADSPRELAKRCAVVFTSLPGPIEIESVALGQDGLIGALKAGAAWVRFVDQFTSTYTTALQTVLSKGHQRS